MNDIEFAEFPTRIFDEQTDAAKGEVGGVASTLTELVCQLTSNQVLNYDLVADFFLTYRAFTTASEIQQLLFSRLVWAFRRKEDREDDETGRDVAVRTFVVIRHWLLNFFADDFLPSLQLRREFVDNLNRIYMVFKGSSNEQHERILTQLRKCWIRSIALYWDVEQDEDEQLKCQYLSSGGNFGSLELDNQNNNNKTIIACYQEPIKNVVPMNEAGDDADRATSASGYLIRGGINVSNDVEVKDIFPNIELQEKSSVETLKPKSSLRTLKSKPSLKKLFHRKKLPAPVPLHTQFVTPDQAFEKERVQGGSGEVRIDILSARVIEELDRVLKCHSLINKTSKDWDESRESALGRSSSDTSRQSSFITEFTDEESLKEPCLTSSSEGESVISYKPQRKNRASIVGDFNAAEERIMSSAASSRLDVTSICSYESYDSEKSVCIQKETTLLSRDNHAKGLLRRQNQMGNLRKAANIVENSPDHGTSSSSLNTGSSRFSVGTTQINQVDPFSAVDEKFAAELAAIPDDTPDDDAIAAALEKLEGTYIKKPSILVDDEDDSRFRIPSTTTINASPVRQRHLGVIGASSSTRIHMDSDVDSNLYNDAFASSVPTPHETDLEQLNIPINETNEDNDDEFYDHNSNNSINQIPQLVRKFTNGSGGNNNHTPFILNYKSKLLSEQLTLIEKDALGQVDWKELIELKWPGSNLDPIQNWVTFLSDRRNNRIGGVELVISRFNLVVNWVKSEILLTWSIEQRVETISRFIHIAYQCRHDLRNYATMMQIILALGSPIIARLKNTWSLVDKLDLKMFQQMEELILPMGNFANLRKELNETMGTFGDSGCIPFVGMYLSDLTFNAEQPTIVDENKINFKKFTTAAGIVKSLVQCIQWSEKYSFKCDENVLSKCLYLHSLTIEEMEACFLYLSDN